MEIKTILSYLGGYFNNNTYELDFPKIADIAEISEEEVMDELNKLQSKGDISLNDNKVTLINISPKTNKAFNDLYKPVETMIWHKNTKIKLDV